ncbi:antitoxin HicB [Nocardioides marmoriginsengisoli]|uniref:Antitoxin HicB n=1 Tax=Nocardioides marmoriginsengisoli TaxID=661483 RepID=A0A3N0CKT9_9ACTN|nr:antitoxin HicB [Nocardioides marmoriginsengisoli]RNL63636.1 antitoxin HicB [Nocardioides marmoriginsengisoli]
MNVTAKQWEHGWELHVEGVGVTQVRTLANAAQQAADLVETMTGEAVSADAMVVRVEIEDGLAERAERVRVLLKDAESASALAAKESREVVAALRAKGLSVTDAAVVMGVSRGRISQLAAR